MQALEQLRQQLPDVARDIKLNLQAVLTSGSLTEGQRWGVAAACAITARNPALREATLQDALQFAGEAVVDDAKAAAALMAMNNVYYRFRHMAGKDVYNAKPARLRMTRIAQPKTSKVDFELYCLAVSAINACEQCIRAHERTVTEHGLTDEHVHDAIRIAATIQATAISLEL
jgi:alkyl hydroperoxide reductase subunit D